LGRAEIGVQFFLEGGRVPQISFEVVLFLRVYIFFWVKVIEEKVREGKSQRGKKSE
jgi:hypothetical protein